MIAKPKSNTFVEQLLFRNLLSEHFTRIVMKRILELESMTKRFDKLTFAVFISAQRC